MEEHISATTINEALDSDEDRTPLTNMLVKYRDDRIDLFRGLALLIIMSDHMIGNPLIRFSPVSWGYADMADLFVFLSGYLNGRSVARWKYSLTRPYGKYLSRAAICFLAYVFMSTITLMLAQSFSVLPAHSVSDHFLVSSYQETALNVVTLNGYVGHLSILLLYTLLLTMTPLIIDLFRFQWHRLILGSITVYLFSDLLWNEMPAYPFEALHYNPFAWQFTFFLGTSLALMEPEIRERWLGSKAALTLSVLTLITLAYMKLSGTLPVLLTLKQHAGPLRILSLLAAAILARKCLPSNFNDATKQAISPIVACARQPLFTYCFGATLSMIATLCMKDIGDSTLAWCCFNGIAWTACCYFVRK